MRKGGSRDGRAGFGKSLGFHGWPCFAVAGWVGVGLAMGASRAHAQVLVEQVRSFVVGETLNEIEDPPRTWMQVVSGTGISVLTEVKVGLKLVGAPDGFASDMVVMLTKDLSRTSVLLNQVGIGVGSGVSSLIGYGYNGWDVTFSDGAVRGDVHGFDLGNGILTGEIAPDGRVTPVDVGRPWTLGVFQGLPGDGIWHLSIADVSAGGSMRLEGWSLTLKGWTSVPEPEAAGTACGMALILAMAWKRMRGVGGW